MADPDLYKTGSNREINKRGPNDNLLIFANFLHKINKNPDLGSGLPFSNRVSHRFLELKKTALFYLC